MATSNFHNVNASRIFAVDLEDEFDYENIILNLESALACIPEYIEGACWDRHELRSYPSKVLGRLQKDNVEVYVIVRSGYYSGCNLDWDIYYDESPSKTDEATGQQLIDKLEKLYAQWSMPLKVKARFSNGETWYEKA